MSRRLDRAPESLRARPIAVRIVKEIDDPDAGFEFRGVRDAGGHEVFVAGTKDAGLALDRQDEFARDHDPPLRAMGVFGDRGLSGGLDEGRTGGRATQQPQADPRERGIRLREVADDLGKSGHVPRNERPVIKLMTSCGGGPARPRMAGNPDYPP